MHHCFSVHKWTHQRRQDFASRVCAAGSNWRMAVHAGASTDSVYHINMSMLGRAKQMLIALTGKRGDVMVMCRCMANSAILGRPIRSMWVQLEYMCVCGVQVCYYLYRTLTFAFSQHMYLCMP